MAQQGSNRRTNLQGLWMAIEQAGGTRAYISRQLREQGFLVERRATDNMSKSELKVYKQQLKQEAEEKRRLKAECWQAYKANHIVHVGEGIYWNDNDDWDKWDVENAEERAAENELPALDSPRQLAELLGLSIPQLRWLSYHRDVAEKIHYRRFTIPKRSGGEREIWAPMPLLKKTQQKILRNIVENLYVHGASHGFLPRRSIHTNALVHTDAEIIVKLDIQNFFPTISLPRVKGLFRKAGYRERIATLLALLCTEAPRKIVDIKGKTHFVSLGERCLPQGAPTSPAISNALCLSLDRRLSGLAEKLGWRYTRYADDITYSLPKGGGKPESDQGSLTTLLFATKAIVADEGFQVHPDKTRISRSGGRQQVTGLIVNGDDGPRVPRQRKRQLRAAIHNLKRGGMLPEGETIASLQGYAAFVCMTDPALGHAMLKELEALAEKYHYAEFYW